MQRIRELIRGVIATYPNDDFFSRIDETLRCSSQARAIYRAYNQALSHLDKDSWSVLSNKAISHFRDHRSGQLKQGFFNQLNDAFAYQFLVRQGCSKVSILREGKMSTPDLSYFHNEKKHFCEVKTIGVSQDEISRRESESAFDGAVYAELSKEFLQKLSSTLREAQCQIDAQQSTGLIFVVVQFDDFTMAYYDKYQEQISNFLKEHSASDVYVKIGVIGGRRIGKGEFAPRVRKT